MIKLDKIHSDDRGTISIITGDLGAYPEISVFETNKGMARGGCIHKNSFEHICVLSGRILFTYGERHLNQLLLAGQTLTIPPNTPHYFVALENSIVMEWGPQMEEKNTRHEEFRKIVDFINGKAGK